MTAGTYRASRHVHEILGQLRSFFWYLAAMLAAAVGACIFAAVPTGAAARDSGFNAGNNAAPAFVSSCARTDWCRVRQEGSGRNGHGPLHAKVARADGAGKPPGRRKKKNKYASFSKADKQEQDPFEAMVSESMEKVKQIEVEKARKKNKRVPLDDEELQLKRQEKRERNKMQFPDTKKIDPYGETIFPCISLISPFIITPRKN
uniref:Uncharacterized protein n=1 Tax=Odontella aurita TaxID=265563 RepID=A0A7S4JQC5_9STRA|mmetsp:Transcript_51517/g.154666  ORF Transcript_51517/g.154666 Transcript_51517/m.154666 type:complete len:204 (+) Transcript_51517:372-983(+)